MLDPGGEVIAKGVGEGGVDVIICEEIAVDNDVEERVQAKPSRTELADQVPAVTMNVTQLVIGSRLTSVNA